MQGNKDKSAIKHILDYCERIQDTAEFFSFSKEHFLENHIFRDAVSLCVLQIGELTGILSDSFKEKYSNIQWRQIKALRNIVAHHYGKIDSDLLWEILLNDIPQLQADCKRILEEMGK